MSHDATKPDEPECKVEKANGHLKVLIEAMTAMFSIVVMYHGSEVAHKLIDRLHMLIHFAEATRGQRKEPDAKILNPNTQEEIGGE